MANIALDDATILPYQANPDWMQFSERTGGIGRFGPIVRGADQRVWYRLAYGTNSAGPARRIPATA